jgi:hypothetical protein
MSFHRKLRRQLNKTSSKGIASGHDIEDVQASFVQRAVEEATRAGLQVDVNTESTGLPKLSQRLIELVDADLVNDLSRRERESLFTQVALAWNTANLQLEGHDRMAEEVLLKQREVLGESGNEIFLAFVERKKRMFPDDLRQVAGVEIIEKDGRFLINVASVRRDAVRRGL